MAKKNRKQIICIGTSGWSYHHWDKVFYPKMKSTERLKYYATFFSTVEINTTFYHLPLETSVKNWTRQVSKDFIFSVKASRYITHLKRLTDYEEAVPPLFEKIILLGKKLGPILFQLPPSFQMDSERLESFVEKLPKKYRYVFEFRHPTWYVQGTYDLLRSYNIALCITDLKGTLSPIEVTSDFAYIRLHGPKRAYKDSYSDSTLKKWKERIEQWEKENKSVFCYFDNDEKGYAVQDALRLKRLLGPHL